MAVAFLCIGFILAVAGLWMWSVPLALVVAGSLMFVSGGLEYRRTHGRTVRKPL